MLQIHASYKVDSYSGGCLISCRAKYNAALILVQLRHQNEFGQPP